MGLLDDTAIFTAIIQQGGFSHAAKHLGLSNGLISRRIAQLEANLGVTLIKRTTRHIQLTPEGELFWQHAKRIQQEMDSAVSLIQSSAKKPKGVIRISAPNYFGRRYLTEMIAKFMDDFSDIHVELFLSNLQVDLIEDKFDLVIRGAGYLDKNTLKDSGHQMKTLLQEKIGLYASPHYLNRYEPPNLAEDLMKHRIIHFSSDQQPHHKINWTYAGNNQVILKPSFTSNDIESCLSLCIHGEGVGRFTELNARDAMIQKKLIPVLPRINWGDYHLFAVYPKQKSLPQRTRLLFDFIDAHTRNLIEKI